MKKGRQKSEKREAEGRQKGGRKVTKGRQKVTKGSHISEKRDVDK